jgi:UDP-N-acetylmuramoylalanine--D-glutamate ligase
MDLRGRNVVVIGLGESGVAAAELCLAHGARVVATDSAPRDRLTASAVALETRGALLIAGGHDAVPWHKTDLVVVSPGVPPLPVLDQASRRGIEVVGELELASRFVTAPIVAVGGTNGKSTTTTLVFAMLEAAGKNVFAGGNLGVPLARAASADLDVLVVEVSSFQTERVTTFHPRVAALLNVTDDHLDRYPSFDAYAAAKGNMFVRQVPDDVAVIPKGDPVALREARRGDGRIVTFGPGGDLVREGDAVVDRLRRLSYPLASMTLQGEHNVQNVCAAVACASEMGAGPEAIVKALATFAGLSHRTALVAEIDGVRYYDDSKGTNVGATVAALRGLAEPRVVLIAGGRDKLGTYEPLAAELAKKGRAVVVMGEAADRIASAAEPVLTVARAATMAEAVVVASKLARPGDAVLLSPACSSFDMFKDYKERGDAFVSAVQALGRGGGAC